MEVRKAWASVRAVYRKSWSDGLLMALVADVVIVVPSSVVVAFVASRSGWDGSAEKGRGVRRIMGAIFLPFFFFFFFDYCCLQLMCKGRRTVC